jgi:hypothetical protein
VKFWGDGFRKEERYGGVERRTLISLIDSAVLSVERRGKASPVKWQRTISRMGEAGRETETMRERRKAQRRRTVPRKKT